MASDKQNPFSLPESQAQKEQFVTNENLHKETRQQSVLMCLKQLQPLVSIENISSLS